MAVKYCRDTGMLRSGVIRPESSAKGMISMNENSIACCMA